MARAIIVHEHGGPERLRPGTVEVGPPGPGEVRIRHTAIGVNYIDTYFRRGLYPIELPAVVGDQAVGVVESVGPGVAGLAVGDHVGYGSDGRAYVEERTIAADAVVRLPDDVDEEVIAATLTRGLTAEYLLRRLYTVQPGDAVVVHAATGGTGLIVTQWARHLGARVIGTVGDASKLAAARDAGAELALLHGDEDLVAKVREFTAGRGADVVYDSIGRTTFGKSLECLRPRGLMVAYGNASGKPEPLDVLALARLGSLFLTRPRLGEYVSTQAELELSASRYFEVLRSGVVRPSAVQRFALEDAAAAHAHLEDRSLQTLPVLVP